MGVGVGRREMATCPNNKTFSPLRELFGAGDPMFFQQFSRRVSGHFEQHLMPTCWQGGQQSYSWSKCWVFAHLEKTWVTLGAVTVMEDWTY